MTKNMKIFVVGSTSAKATDWSIWDEVAIVIAENKKQAAKMTLYGAHADITEIPLNKAQVLIQKDEPDWGDDI